MIDLRKLAAIDIALLGYKVILAEYAFAVMFFPARREIGPELADQPAAMARFRRLSLALLVPLLPVGLMVARSVKDR